MAIAAAYQGFEDLFGRQADIAGDSFGAQIVLVHLVVADFVTDAKRVENPHGVGLHGRLPSASALSVKTWVV